MIFIYRLSVYLYGIAIRISSVWNPKARQWLKGRKDWLQAMNSEIDKNENIAWFHCASLGEFEQGRPVMEEFRLKHPPFKILLTFFSPSGYEIRKNYEGADYIFYLPMDSPSNARRFISLVKPKIVFFVKYEFWYFFIHEIHKHKIPVFLISAIFRKSQIFFKSYGQWYRKVLHYFDHIFVQDSESASLLKSINVSNASKSGDTRFDRVYAIAQQSIELPLIRHFKADRFLIVAGSTWPQDEDLLSKFITEAHSKICLIVAPHEIHQSNIKRIHKIFPGSPVLYSNANINNNAHERVMIINNIGLLSSVYKYADIAYVGGAFKTGLHNILEPACFSLPVVFGPEYSKFREASEMIGLDIAISIRNYSELKGKLNSLMSNKEILREKSNNAGNYIKSKVGATLMIIDKTYDILIKTK